MMFGESIQERVMVGITEILFGHCHTGSTGNGSRCDSYGVKCMAYHRAKHHEINSINR